MSCSVEERRHYREGDSFQPEEQQRPLTLVKALPPAHCFSMTREADRQTGASHAAVKQEHAELESDSDAASIAEESAGPSSSEAASNFLEAACKSLRKALVLQGLPTNVEKMPNEGKSPEVGAPSSSTGITDQVLTPGGRRQSHGDCEDKASPDKMKQAWAQLELAQEELRQYQVLTGLEDSKDQSRPWAQLEEIQEGFRQYEAVTRLKELKGKRPANADMVGSGSCNGAKLRPTVRHEPDLTLEEPGSSRHHERSADAAAAAVPDHNSQTDCSLSAEEKTKPAAANQRALTMLAMMPGSADQEAAAARERRADKQMRALVREEEEKKQAQQLRKEKAEVPSLRSAQAKLLRCCIQQAWPRSYEIFVSSTPWR